MPRLVIVLSGRDAEQALAELKSNIEFDHLNVKVELYHAHLEAPTPVDLANDPTHWCRGCGTPYIAKGLEELNCICTLCGSTDTQEYDQYLADLAENNLPG
jgi:hypothetical protein